MHRQRVFLVIDNVREKQIEDARTFLQAGYRSGSIVLVTSRSLGILKSLSIMANDCIEMLELEEKDATNLFLQHAADPHWSLTEDDKTIIKRCVEQCQFSKRDVGGLQDHDRNASQYLPLALKVWGCQLRSISENPSRWVEALTTLETHKFNVSKEQPHPIFSLLRQGYDALPEKEQHIFLDLALYVPQLNKVEHVWKWLSDIHRTSQDAIKGSLYVLRRKAVIEEVSEDDLQIRIHDLYLEFAKDEAQGAGPFHKKRLLYDVGGTHVHPHLLKKPPQNFWSNLERILIRGSTVPSLKKANFQLSEKFTSELLHAPNLSGCISLRELTMTEHERMLNFPDFSNLTKLEHVKFSSCESVVSVPNLSNLLKLKELVLFSCSKISESLTGLSSLSSLQVLNLRQCKYFTDLSGLCELIGLQSLTCAETNISELPDLRKLAQLRDVDVHQCSNLRNILGIEHATALRTVDARNCRNLKELPNFSNFMEIEVFDLRDTVSCTTLPEGIERLGRHRILRFGGCWGLVVPLADLLKELNMLNKRRVHQQSRGYSSKVFLWEDR